MPWGQIMLIRGYGDSSWPYISDLLDWPGQGLALLRLSSPDRRQYDMIPARIASIVRRTPGGRACVKQGRPRLMRLTATEDPGSFRIALIPATAAEAEGAKPAYDSFGRTGKPLFQTVKHAW